VRRYLAYIWDSDHPVDLIDITSNLSQSLSFEFTMLVTGTVLANWQTFCKIFSKTLLIELTQIFSESTILPDEYIISENEDRY
jgi:hypothetical protein